ncbi:histone methylation protein DOT1 [Aureococcus anophagefferens]|nr:histone methylation protein DOT1 [Aureococcus anophagefferens]
MSALDAPPPAAAPAPSAPKHPDLRAAMARVELRNEASASPSDAALEEPRRVYEAIFGRWPATHGKIISKRERDARGMNASSLVYGEINFASGAAKGRDVPDFEARSRRRLARAALLKIKAVYGRPGVGASGDGGVMQAPGSGVFYDLGSGAGKPAAAAAALPSSARRAEYLGGLVRASRDAKAAYEEKVTDPADESDPPGEAPVSAAWGGASVRSLLPAE